MEHPVFVTQPSLAPLPEFTQYLQQIWETGIMTHNGPLLKKLELEIAAYEGLQDAICVSNGTCALQLAIRALDLEGEIITTPFSFIATANIIAWERCIPVFVDIDAESWNINPAAIEAAITDRTSAIMPVHVFSAPCDVDHIKQISDKHGLKVIYDAAHAMCVRKKSISVMSYGDVACTSFHATKLFTTCEGGACFTSNRELADRIRRMRFFGFDESKEIVDKGMNAKMTEIAAGLGLANLRHLDAVRRCRKRKHELYQSLLADCDFLEFQKINPDEYNYSYMPVLFDSEARSVQILEKLAEGKIHPRRYFYPSLAEVPIFKKTDTPVAMSISSRIACLPLYNSLPDESIIRICEMIKTAI